MTKPARKRAGTATKPAAASLADALQAMDSLDGSRLSQLKDSGLPGTEEIDTRWPEAGRLRFLSLLLGDELSKTEAK